MKKILINISYLMSKKQKRLMLFSFILVLLVTLLETVSLGSVAGFVYFISDPEKTVDGFLAHEVSEIVPHAVVGEKDAVNEDGSIASQGIDKSKLVPLLVASVQELSAKVTALENATN